MFVGDGWRYEQQPRGWVRRYVCLGDESTRTTGEDDRREWDHREANT